MNRSKRIGKPGKQWILALIVAAAAGMMLTACADRNSPGEHLSDGLTMNNARQNAPAGDQVPPHMHDGGIIPNYFGPKTETTNMQGQTTSGLGMNIYSMIGSSGLHEGGVSSHIQSRLNGLGIEGIKVFVLNDTVILAGRDEGVPSGQMSRMQMKLLSPTEGMSGKGEPEGISAQKADEPQNNLELAVKQVSGMFGGNARIVTVSNPASFELIDRIAAKLHDGSWSDPSIARDIARLLSMVNNSEQPGTNRTNR